MKFIKASNGKQRISLSKAEWLDLGKKAGWVKTAQDSNFVYVSIYDVNTQIASSEGKDYYYYYYELKNSIRFSDIAEANNFAQKIKEKLSLYDKIAIVENESKKGSRNGLYIREDALEESEKIASKKFNINQKTAQDFNDFGPIEDLDIEEEQPEDQLHDDDLKYEIETETKAWFDVVVESEDLMVEGRPDVQGLANRIYEIVQGSLAAGMQDKGSLKRDIYSAASDWLADEDRKGTVSIFEEIPSFHFKSIAQRICTRAMDRDNLV